MPEAALAQLKGFISLCKAQPQIIHRPELKFFKDYLMSLKAELPPPPAEEKEATPEPKKEEPKEEKKEESEVKACCRIIHFD